MAQHIEIRRDTAANWTAANPVLASGEPAIETDTGRRKLGDGVTAWTALPYDGALLAADPALRAAYGLRAGVAYVDSYGGDPTGVADSTAAFNAALASLPAHPDTGYPMGQVVFSSGIYRINSSTNNIGPSCHVRGQGVGGTLVRYYGTGWCFRQFSSWFPNSSYNVPIENTYLGGGVTGLTLDGTNAAAGAIGVKYGDVLSPRYDLVVRHFNGAGSIGMQQVNTISWTEKVRNHSLIFDCTTHFQVSVDFADETTTIAQAATLPAATIKLAGWKPSFPRPVGPGTGPVANIYVDGQKVTYTGYTINGDGTATLTGCAGGTGTLSVGDTVQFGSGGGSHAYSEIDLSIGANPGQDGVVVQNSANLYGGQLVVRGNMAISTSAQSNAALRVGGVAPVGTRLSPGGGAQIIYTHLDVQMEAYGGGTNYPQTLNITTTGGSYIRAAYGILRFGGNWTPSNITIGNAAQLGFLGYVIGDTTLNPDANTATAPSPHVRGPLTLQAAGWNPTGPSINLNDGDFIDITLNAASTGTMAFNNPPAAPQRKTVVVRQQSTGGTYNRSVTWPTNGSPTTASPTVVWSGGVAPTLSQGAGAFDVYRLETIDGATWFGSVLLTSGSSPLNPITKGAVVPQITTAGGGITAAAAIGSAQLTNQTAYAMPVAVATAITATKVVVNVTAPGNTGATVHFGIYSDTGAGPGGLLLDCGSAAADVGGTCQVTISQALAAGVYWLVGLVGNAATTAPTVNTLSGQLQGMPAPVNASGAINGYAMPGQASLPGTFLTNQGTTNACPRMVLVT